MDINSLMKRRPLLLLLFTITAVGFAAVVGIFFGYYPVRKASRLLPIEALRYEQEDIPMELLLWRHAEAEEAAVGQPDMKRRLTGRGEKQARHIAEWLCKRQPRHMRILSSPAERCQQTARALALPYAVAAEIGVGADPGELIKAAGWPAGEGKTGGAVLLIGHQPTLGRLAAVLLTGREADWDVKKGALWWFSSQEGKTLQLRAVVNPDLV